MSSNICWLSSGRIRSMVSGGKLNVFNSPFVPLSIFTDSSCFNRSPCSLISLRNFIATTTVYDERDFDFFQKLLFPIDDPLGNANQILDDSESRLDEYAESEEMEVVDNIARMIEELNTLRTSVVGINDTFATAYTDATLLIDRFIKYYELILNVAKKAIEQHDNLKLDFVDALEQKEREFTTFRGVEEELNVDANFRKEQINNTLKRIDDLKNLYQQLLLEKRSVHLRRPESPKEIRLPADVPDVPVHSLPRNIVTITKTVRNRIDAERALYEAQRKEFLKAPEKASEAAESQRREIVNRLDNLVAVPPTLRDLYGNQKRELALTKVTLKKVGDL